MPEYDGRVRKDLVIRWRIRHELCTIDWDDQWVLHTRRWHTGETGNRKRYVMSSHNGKTTYMHRLIMMRVDSSHPELHVDHINHDGLDNRRSNLRWVTVQQNQWNRARQPSVTLRRGRWRARIRWIDGKQLEKSFAIRDEALAWYAEMVVRRARNA